MYQHLHLNIAAKEGDGGNNKKEQRYLFYDVNMGEGFNLRRDVFMRIAILVKNLNKSRLYHYTLVLPPWGRLYHWQSRHLGDQIRYGNIYSNSRLPFSLYLSIHLFNRI